MYPFQSGILHTAKELATCEPKKTLFRRKSAPTKLLSDELRMPHDILYRYSNIYELYDDILA